MNRGDQVIYLDNAATTPLHPSAREAMLPYLSEVFANPSSMYTTAREVRKSIDNARQITASAINADPSEIFFTAGGTEADNWALLGVAEAKGNEGGHIITSTIEHPGIQQMCEHLKSRGFEITTVEVDHTGKINPAHIKREIRPNTCLVSIMLANNEVGTIQPLAEIAKITQAHKIPLHTDAVQAVGHIPVDVKSLGVDILSLSAHKFYGPKGAGALYVRKGVAIAPMLFGGAQERNRRAGTENVMGIVGLAAALAATQKELQAEQSRLTSMRDALIQEIQSNIPYTKLNGATGKDRLPGNINISFRFIEGESLLLHLDMHGIYASTGSACSSGALEPSHVLMSMGLDHEHANGAIRFTLGRENSKEDITALMKVLTPTVEKLRSMSPLYDDFSKSMM